VLLLDVPLPRLVNRFSKLRKRIPRPISGGTAAPKWSLRLCEDGQIDKLMVQFTLRMSRTEGYKFPLFEGLEINYTYSVIPHVLENGF